MSQGIPNNYSQPAPQLPQDWVENLSQSKTNYKLALSPCVRHRQTGEIHVYGDFFAAFPDVWENCDENGNTDPYTWQGRGPLGSRLPNIAPPFIVGQPATPRNTSPSMPEIANKFYMPAEYAIDYTDPTMKEPENLQKFKDFKIEDLISVIEG